MKYSKLFKSIITLSVMLITAGASFADISTDAKLKYNKGIDFYKLGQFEEAVTCFKEAIDLDPNYVDAYYNLGSILEYLKQDDAALTVFKQIILRKPDDYEAAYKAAQLSYKLGEVEKTRMYLTLIPKDTLIGQRAAAFESRLNEEYPQGIKEEPQQTAVVHQTNTNDTNGIFSNIASPTGVVTDNLGNLYVAGFSDNTIYKITPENNKIVYIKSPKIDGPIGIAMDSTGCIYIANYNKDNVVKVNTNGEITILINNVLKPYCMYIANDVLFVSSQGSNSVIRYKL